MSAPHAKHGSPTYEQIIEIADQIAECGIFKVELTGGDSLESSTASLRVFMATLRKKLMRTPDSPAYIQTHVGVGYRMIRVEETTE